MQLSVGGRWKPEKPEGGGGRENVGYLLRVKFCRHWASENGWREGYVKNVATLPKVMHRWFVLIYSLFS